jgi:hypothetical protein
MIYLRLCIVYLFWAASISHAQRNEDGTYSKKARPLWDMLAGSNKPVIVPSPDGKSSVVATFREGKDTHVILNLKGSMGSLRLDLDPGVGSELLWAPDSKAFFVTSSDAGGNGGYHLYVVDNFEGKLQSRELTELIDRKFGHPVRCDPKGRYTEPPNVGGIGWVSQTHHIWVAAEIVAHSLCDSFGTFQAYEVDPGSMTIIRTLDQLDAKRELRSMLGRELLNAPDQCVRNPKACYVRTNHPELESK